MEPFLKLIKPGTILDGEVVMNRGGKNQAPRPIFIVFDVLTVGLNLAVLHLPFEQRLYHLRQASFRTKNTHCDAMFNDNHIGNSQIALPLVRKNFVTRTQISKLLRHVVEDENGSRRYSQPTASNGVIVHNHLTDGIIFQPNRPYRCGTDVNLFKWKYLDTVTVDVEVLSNHRHIDAVHDTQLKVGILGPNKSRIDMSRHIHLPKSERYRMEADKAESGGRIAEIGFEPDIGEWYYLTMRPDKPTPNHITTVVGAMLELSESLSVEELQYRMSVKPELRDAYCNGITDVFRKLLEKDPKDIASSCDSDRLFELEAWSDRLRESIQNLQKQA